MNREILNYLSNGDKLKLDVMEAKEYCDTLQSELNKAIHTLSEKENAFSSHIENSGLVGISFDTAVELINSRVQALSSIEINLEQSIVENEEIEDLELFSETVDDVAPKKKRGRKPKSKVEKEVVVSEKNKEDDDSFDVPSFIN